MLLRLLLLACALLQLADAEVAVSQEWAHAEFIGQRLGVPEIGVRRPDLRRITVGGDFAEKAQRPRLRAAFTALTGDPAVAPAAGGSGDRVTRRAAY